MKPLSSKLQLVNDYRNFCADKNKLKEANAKLRVRCNACHEALTNDEAVKNELIYSLGKAWHRNHFICISCHCVIGADERDFRECPTDKHFAMCLDCFMEENHPRCQECDRVVRETCVTAMNKLWHERCLKCNKCHSPFSGGRFCLLNEKAYCMDCYNLVLYSSLLLPQSQLTEVSAAAAGYGASLRTFPNEPDGSDRAVNGTESSDSTKSGLSKLVKAETAKQEIVSANRADSH